MRRKFALGLLLALGVIVAGAIGAITVTTFNIVDYIGVGTAPSNPGNSKGRLYFSTADSQLHCLTHSGASCLSGGGGGSTPCGADTQIQFNDAGSCGADVDLTWTKTTGTFNAAGLAGAQHEISAGNNNIQVNGPSAQNSVLVEALETGGSIGLASDGLMSLTSNSGNVTISTPGGLIKETVADAAAVTPGSVTQRVVTTSPDPIVFTDRWQRVVYNSASAVAVTLPQAGVATGFSNGFNVRVSNQAAGTVTITPTISTINGNATLVLLEGQDCFITPSANGANYAADCNEPQMLAGSNVSLTRGVHSVTIGLTGLSPAPATLAPVANTFVTGYTQSTGAWTTSQVLGNSVNGALSASAFTFSGLPISGGSGTTNFPLLAFWPTGVTAPTTWNAGQIYIGINANNTTCGSLFEAHLNGGGIQYRVDCSGGVTMTTGNSTGNFKANSMTIVNQFALTTAPTIAGAGCGGSAAAISGTPNGTISFNVNVGTAPAAGGCTITMPAATTTWNCLVNDQTTTSTTVSFQKQTGANSTTSVVVQNFSDVAVATAPTANDIYHLTCHAN